MPDPATAAAAETFYVTTPIYYVNARPHIGHAYTTIVADVVARRHRLLGHDTFFLTGTDEHGQKIERSAEAAGIPPQQFADGVSQSFRDLWHRMGITYTGSPAAPALPGLPSFERPEAGFIRTTDPEHIRGVQHLFQQLCDHDAIYKGTYTGQYCVSDEAYVDGPPGIHCPDCGRPTETVSEENYYFRLSRFQLPLLNLIESDTLRIEPDSRRNEVLSFLRGPVSSAQPSPSGQTLPPITEQSSSRPEESAANRSGETPVSAPAQSPDTPSMAQSDISGAKSLAHTAAGTPYLPDALKDLSISRTSFSWGIPVPGDEKHVIYVWLDALANYMTAIGYGSDDRADQALFHRFWPADLHLVGKEIIRFHCVYWPAFLLALDPNWATLAEAATATATPLSASTGPHSPSAAPHPASTTPQPPSSRPEESEASRSGETPVLSTPAQLPAAPNTTAPSWLSSRSAAEGSASLPKSAGAPSLGFNQAFTAKWLPKSVVAHGWLLFEQSKMSKSRGNIVRTETILQAFGDQYLQGIRDHNARELKKDPTFTPVAEPIEHDCDLFATDVLRYFLLREIPFGQDGSFSFDAMVTRYNADLANGYGNLVSRVLGMLRRYFDSTVPERGKPLERTYENGVEIDAFSTLQLGHGGGNVATEFGADLEASNFQRGLLVIWDAISARDEMLSGSTPWKIADNPDLRPILSAVLYTAAESIRILTALLYPILPFSTARVWAQLGLGSIEEASARGDLRNLQWGRLQPGTRLGPLAPIFPRAEKGLAQTMADLEQNARPSATPTADLRDVATDEHDAATPDRTAFREAPLASAGPGTPDQLLAAEASSEAGIPSHPAPAGSAPADPGGLTSRPPARSAALLHAAPSPLSDGTAGLTTSPSAPPRTSSALVEAEPILQVGGSSAPVPELPRTPSHVAAEPSGVFASSTAGTPITSTPADATPQITIDDFAKVELRVAQVLTAERIPKADKLLRLQVDLGHEQRQILSGIAEWYAPEDLLGRRIIVVTNLAPRKMRGLDSHGMLLAASAPADPGNPQSSKPILATVPEPIPLGTRLK